MHVTISKLVMLSKRDPGTPAIKYEVDYYSRTTVDCYSVNKGQA